MTLSFAQWLASHPPAALATILTARPDAIAPPTPRHLRELSHRLEIPGAVLDTVHTLPTPALEVIEVLQLLGPDQGGQRPLAEWLGCATEDPALTEILTLLATHALVWPDGEALHLVDPLYTVFAYPLGLAAPAAELLSPCPAEQLRSIARALGLHPLPRRKAELVNAIGDQLRDPARVRALLAEAPPAARAQLWELATDGPEPAADSPVWYGYRRLDDHLRWGAERGLVLIDAAHTPVMPREAAVALRGADWRAPYTPQPPPLSLVEVPPETVAREAVAAGAAAVDRLAAVLSAIDTAPVSMRKTGGVGVRELRRLARHLGDEEPTVRFWLELAHGAGLIAPVRRDDLTRLLPTDQYDEWAAAEPADRLAAVLSAWYHLPLSVPPTDTGGPPPPALVHDEPGRFAALLRGQLIALLAGLPTGRSVTDPVHLVDQLWWRTPLLLTSLVDDLPPIDQLVRAVWREAELVGAVALGALTPLGRALLAEQPVPLADQLAYQTEQPAAPADQPTPLAAACRRLLPAPVSEAVFQADLTAVVPGSPARALAALLDAAADRESVGGAVTWRFSPGSVRRALDTGHEAPSLLDALRTHAVGGALPQPLVYLVTDVARRHGAVRVRDAGCVLHAADPALVAELGRARALRSLQLSAVAPTVLVSAAPLAETLAALRAAGYAPVAESDDGVPLLTKLTRDRAQTPDRCDEPVGAGSGPELPDPLALAEKLLAAPVPPDPLALAGAGADPLAHLDQVAGLDLAGGGPVATLAAYAPQLSPGERRLLEYAIDTGEPVTIGYVDARGRPSHRTIESPALVGAHLVAWCRLRDDERMFALPRIESVAPA